MYSALLFIACLLASHTSQGQGKELFQRDTFRHDTLSLPYRILYPEQYDPLLQYPLIVFLHGAGERGSDNESQLIHGAAFLLRNRASYPAIVIAPQCPLDGYWANVTIKQVKGKRTFVFGETDVPTPAMRLAMALVEQWVSSGEVDRQRVYVGGLSMGGMGTYEMLWRMPGVFAAAFPICGGGVPSKVGKDARHTAVWVFHGAKDKVVPVNCSRQMVAALRAAKAEVNYTEYPEANHNSWNSAFAEPQLMPWLFSHKRE